MAIEVLKHGCVRFTEQCHVCGARFTYSLDDLWCRTAYGGGYVPCPTCHTHITHRYVATQDKP